MASPKIKPKVPLTPNDAWGPVEFDVRNDVVAASRFEPGRAQFEFDAPAGQAAEYWRAVRILAAVAVAASVAIAALVYFAGPLAGGIAAAMIGTLIAFGNWVLNSTADLF